MFHSCRRRSSITPQKTSHSLFVLFRRDRLSRISTPEHPGACVRKEKCKGAVVVLIFDCQLAIMLTMWPKRPIEILVSGIPIRPANPWGGRDWPRRPFAPEGG
jgi:hypothetical protein